MIGLLLTLTPLAAVIAQDTQQMRVRPSTEAEAVAEFESTCVAGLFDFDALRQRAAASQRGYTFQDSPPGGWRNWTSSWGTIHYLQGIDESPSLPQCNFTSFTRTPVSRRALDRALRAMADRSGTQVMEMRGRRGLSWAWFNRDGRGVEVTVYLDHRTPNQITLSLAPYAITVT